MQVARAHLFEPAKMGLGSIDILSQVSMTLQLILLKLHCRFVRVILGMSSGGNISYNVKTMFFQRQVCVSFVLCISMCASWTQQAILQQMFQEGTLHVVRTASYSQGAWLPPENDVVWNEQKMFRDSCRDHPPQENKKPTNPNANHMTEKKQNHWKCRV